MFNRRFIRVKVMQALFSRALDEKASGGHLAKQINKSLHQVWKLYLIQLQTIERLANYALEQRNFEESKFIKSSKAVETKIVMHHFVQAISQSETFMELTESEKIQNAVPDSMIKKLFKEMQSKKFYIDYNNDENRDLYDAKIIIDIFKKLLLKSDLYTSHLEEVFLSWMDDSQLIIKSVLKTIKQFFEKGEPYINYVLLTPDWKESEKYAEQLFTKTIQNEVELQNYLKPVLKNWDASRVNIVDNLLINMALCEFLYFAEIPVKVTINEYIEITKTYSTPKSNEFVNGILDALYKQLSHQNLIVKKGRGLIN